MLRRPKQLKLHYLQDTRLHFDAVFFNAVYSGLKRHPSLLNVICIRVLPCNFTNSTFSLTCENSPELRLLTRCAGDVHIFGTYFVVTSCTLSSTDQRCRHTGLLFQYAILFVMAASDFFFYFVSLSCTCVVFEFLCRLGNWHMCCWVSTLIHTLWIYNYYYYHPCYHLYARYLQFYTWHKPRPYATTVAAVL